MKRLARHVALFLTLCLVGVGGTAVGIMLFADPYSYHNPADTNR